MRLAALLLLAAGAMASAVPVEARTQAAATQPRLAGLQDFVDGVVAQQIDNREVAGAVVSVVSGDKLLFSRGYGFADVERSLRADPARTLFRPGSTSKLFTWTALMQLLEQGRVDLDADVNRYLDFRIPDGGYRPILVRHLLDHSLGFEDRGGIRAEKVEDLKPLGQWLAANIPTRVREPGVETSYSNYGTALAGYIVQRVSGEPFNDYAERHIFKPLGMNRTTFREPLPAALAGDMASGYDLVNGRLEARAFELYGNIGPAGSGSSTAEDMARFMLAHLHDGRLGKARVLKAETVRLMHADRSANAPGLPGFASGFYVVRDAGPRLIGHGGNTAYFHSMMLIAPEQDFGIFVSFTGGDGASEARTELINAVIGRVFPVAPAPRWTGATPLAPVGSYRTNRRTYSEPANPAYDIKVAAGEAGGLVVEIGGRKSFWSPIGPTTFQKVTGARAGGPYDRLTFHGPDGDRKLSFASQPMVLYRLVQSSERNQ